MSKSEKCPNCGYCAACGRSDPYWVRPWQPYPYWQNPWYVTTSTPTFKFTTNTNITDNATTTVFTTNGGN